MEKGVTVLICSYNGADRITRTIEHLGAQRFTKPVDWEIIFVDNASTDDCGNIAKRVWEKTGNEASRFHLVKEKKPGKVYAQNLGVSLARFEYFIVCDDDNWLGPDYVEKVFDLLESNPTTGAVGGRGIAVTDAASLPEWFPHFETHYAVGKQGIVSEDVTLSRGYLWGAGLGSRTELYRKYYIQFPSLLWGRKENEIVGGGEDAEYCLRLVLKGWQLYYDSALVFQHYIPSNRLTVPYRDNLVNIQNGIRVLDTYHLFAKMQRKVQGRPWNHFRLLLVTPFKWLLTTSTQKKALEKNKMRILYPGLGNKDPEFLMIGKFIHEP